MFFLEGKACAFDSRTDQRLEEKRVEEPVGEGEREKEHMHVGEKERERESKALAPPFMFFPPPGPALCKLGLARSAVCST